MKIIYKIKIHIFFYFVFIISILTGNFKLFLSLTLIILFHELGHIIAGLYFKWDIEKIVILPLSSVTIFNTKINKPLYEELIVTLLGPIFQSILFLFIKDKLIFKYNLYLLIFNLLPIYPLDGHKLLQIFLSKIVSYKNLLSISLYISIIFLFVLMKLTNFNAIILIIIFIFFTKIIVEFKNIKLIYNKFLLERYLYGFKSFKKRDLKHINISKLYKYNYHYFITKNKIYNEEEIIGKMFDNQGNIW